MDAGSLTSFIVPRTLSADFSKLKIRERGRRKSMEIKIADFNKNYEKLEKAINNTLYPTRSGVLKLLEAFKTECLKTSSTEFEIIKELRR